MKTTRSVRLPDDLSRALQWIQQREGGDASDAIRRLVRKGLEREMADLYARGKVTLREAAEVLSVPVMQAMDLLRELGVPGNATMEQALEAVDVADALLSQGGVRRKGRGRLSPKSSSGHVGS